jgi:hypothetical protein
MSDTRGIIDKAIAEHHDIRESIKLTGDSLTDVEALFLLRKAYSGWTQSSAEELGTRRDQLLQAVSSLELGLKRHFDFEEKALPPLFGELLMKAIMHEHREIAEKIENTRAAINGIKLEGLDQAGLLSVKTGVQETINHLLQSIEEHANHEEIILKMMKKALGDLGIS